ncbi:MAG: hypothetical protein EOO01_03365 [Chitinophagaceae bacterium]|nr:MAG: hypothetical protein EOO01_03365 [Chitinophagaceae bacterium]
MRVITFLILVLASTVANAQLFYPGGVMGSQRLSLAPAGLSSDTNHLKQKWSLTKYAAISTGFTVMSGGSASFISAPMGLQLNRRITNNIFAFAGLAVAPSYVNLNRSFQGFDMYKTSTPNGRYMNNGLGVFSRAEAGLMYVNDERTFSISGSIGIERSTYPGFHAPSPYRNSPPGFIGTR